VWCRSAFTGQQLVVNVRSVGSHRSKEMKPHLLIVSFDYTTYNEKE
jgi:hypothetical protein